MQSRCHSSYDAQCVFKRYGDFIAPASLEHRPDVLALQILHRDEVLAVRVTDVVDLRDIVVLKLSYQSPFVQEHLNRSITQSAFSMQFLDDYVFLEPLDPGCAGEKDLRHTADGELPHDLIFARSAGIGKK